MQTNKKDGVYFFWSASILVCMLLSIFVLGFASCQSGSEANGKAVAASSESSASSAPTAASSKNTPTILGESADMGQEYVDKFIFLGDSTTYGMGFYKVVSTNQVWTPESGTLTLSKWDVSTIAYHDDNSELSIQDAVTKKQPEYMLITLGVNGVAFMDEEYFVTEYTGLVKAIQTASPNTKIILNSIYPVSVNYPSTNGITNEKIDAANKWIQTIASSTGVKYLDSESVLKDSSGALVETYHNGDYLHLTADSFGLVINYLRTHGYQ
jgi:lysophospholipase L1-like esterase